MLGAALEVMQRVGSGARVADIVAAAGLSNQAFYRHFASKDALVSAVLEDGTVRLRSYLAHRMSKWETPEGKVKAWVMGVLAQAGDGSETVLAVLSNAGGGDGERAPGTYLVHTLLADLLVEPFTALGSTDAELDATMATHAVVGRLRDHLWRGTRSTRVETDHLVALVTRMAAGAS